jgi:streptogramin lyase
MGTLWAHVHDRPPPVSDSLDPVFARGLAKEPGERYAACGDLVVACRAAVDPGEASHTAEPSAAPLLRRREFLIGAGIVALAAAGAIPAILLTRNNESGSSAPLAPPNALARIDVATNRVTNVVADLPAPHALAVGESYVWVLSQETNALVRVDPSTYAVTAQGVPGDPTAVAAGLGAIWITTSFEGVGYLLALDPARPGTAPRRARLEYPDPRGVVVTPDSVWVLAYNSLRASTALLRFSSDLDLSGGVAPLSEVAIPGQPLPNAGTWMAADGDAVWVLVIRPGSLGAAAVSLYRIDPSTTAEPEAVATFVQAESLAVGAGSVWVTTQAESRSVFRVDPVTKSVVQEPWGTRDTGPLVVAHSSLWLGDFLDGLVARINPSSGETTATVQVSEPVPAGIGPPTYTSLEGAHMVGLGADPAAIWALTTELVEVS